MTIEQASTLSEFEPILWKGEKVLFASVFSPYYLMHSHRVLVYSRKIKGKKIEVALKDCEPLKN